MQKKLLDLSQTSLFLKQKVFEREARRSVSYMAPKCSCNITLVLQLIALTVRYKM